MCLFVAMCMWVHVSHKARSIRCPGAGSIGGYQLPMVGAGDQTQDLQTSKQHMLLMTEPSCWSQLLTSWCNVWSPVQPVNQYCPIELGLMMDVLSATLLNSWNMQVWLQGCIQWYMWLPATTLDIGDVSFIEECSAGEHCSPGNQP